MMFGPSLLKKREVIYKLDDQFRDYMFMIISSYVSFYRVSSLFVHVCLYVHVSVCTYLCLSYNSLSLYCYLFVKEFTKYVNAVFYANITCKKKFALL